MRVRAIVEFEASGLRNASDILLEAGLEIIEGPDEVEKEEEEHDEIDEEKLEEAEEEDLEEEDEEEDEEVGD